MHFIGAVKPWHSGAESASFDFLGAWKAVYADAIRPVSYVVPKPHHVFNYRCLMVVSCFSPDEFLYSIVPESSGR